MDDENLVAKGGEDLLITTLLDCRGGGSAHWQEPRPKRPIGRQNGQFLLILRRDWTLVERVPHVEDVEVAVLNQAFEGLARVWIRPMDHLQPLLGPRVISA